MESIQQIERTDYFQFQTLHLLDTGREIITSNLNIVGLIPAAGRASRISPLPCSKELFPVGFCSVEGSQEPRPKVAAHYLMERMRMAGITEAFMVIRSGKWDIPTYFGDGKMLDMNISYLMQDLPYGVPYTLDQAYPFVKDQIVALGFPDMIVEPDSAFSELVSRLEESDAELVLGLFPAEKPHKTDMVEIDESNRIRSIQIKPEKTGLLYAWEIALWRPAFTRYMHDYIEKKKKEPDLHKQKELHVGDIFQAAINDQMKVDHVLFQSGYCLDMGTPNDLITAIQSSL